MNKSLTLTKNQKGCTKQRMCISGKSMIIEEGDLLLGCVFLQTEESLHFMTTSVCF